MGSTWKTRNVSCCATRARLSGDGPAPKMSPEKRLAGQRPTVVSAVLRQHVMLFNRGNGSPREGRAAEQAEDGAPRR